MSSSNKNVENPPERGHLGKIESNIAVSSSEVSSVAGSTKTNKAQLRVSSSSERQIKFERAQKCLENAAQVSKRIKEHRKATAELLGRPFEDEDGGDTASEMASTLSERTGYSVATDVSSTSVLSVQDALNIPGISESLANTLKQKELLMERIKQYKEISKKPLVKSSPISRRESTVETRDLGTKATENITLQNKIKEKENALTIMQVKIKAMETTIMDLQEKLSEKDQIIAAKTKATSLMSDSLSKKEKDSVTLLEDTRQQMTKMQENFIAMETEWKQEKQNLLNEIESKNEKISSLEEANTILENSRFEISLAHEKLTEEIELRNTQISDLEEKLNKLKESKAMETTETVKKEVEEEKGSLEISGMVELTKKIELLEQLNCQIRLTNKELENRLASSNVESKSPASGSPSKKASPVPTRKGGGRNTAAKAKSPWSKMSSESLPQETDKKQNKNEVAKLEMIVQSLNKEILEKEYVISQKDALVMELTNLVSEKEVIINDLSTSKQAEIANTTPVDTVDTGTVTEILEQPVISSSTKLEDVSSDDSNVENPVEVIQILREKLRTAEEQITALNEEIETANKNMIKVKSNQKLKLKQMQKTIENFSKVSDSNAEFIKLNEELHQLTQKVAELEEEKGNLQLHLVDYDSGRLTESDSYKKMLELENLAELRLKAISSLETQKFELVQDLHDLQQKNTEMEDKLADMSQLQNEQVCSEMKSVQLEEQLDSLTASKKELELVIENIKLDKDQLNGSIKHLQEEKDELTQKLDHYIQKNLELSDKLEKLSAEKVSSAESIEIVESLTTQEKLELEEYNKGMIDNNKIEAHPSDQYKESTNNERNEIEKLVQESAELNAKIELFTQERQEVMERLNKLSAENETLQENILLSNSQISELQSNIDIINKEKQELQSLTEDLNQQIEELKRERVDIMKESVELNKPVAEDTGEFSQDAQQDDKGEKGNKGAKSVKQLTKEILKLKNTIKEREAEIGDCQMKILSLEEQQQKQNESLKSIESYEHRIKSLMEDNEHLKEELNNIKQNKEYDNQIIQLRETNEMLQQEIQKIQHEYAATISNRDSRIQELEDALHEYKKQIENYANTLHVKHKEVNDYLNQIAKLNEVSQKLKSSIELLEEEKSKDQNAELVKSLNKQINVYQKKLAECEDKLRVLEEEKSQLLTMKVALENKLKSYEIELKTTQESLLEKQTLIKSLQIQQEKHAEEMTAITEQTKERDEEIHEIKLQLRKESIEYEKLRTSLDEKEKIIQNYSQDSMEAKDIKDKLNQLNVEKDELKELHANVEIKNKELLEKLKKFAGNLKKKTGMYNELESKYNEIQKDIEVKNHEIEQLSLQVQGLPAMQEKLKYAEEELNRLLSHKVQTEQQQSQDLIQIQNYNKQLLDKLNDQNFKFNESFNSLKAELQSSQEQNSILRSEIDSLNNKLVEYEIEQKNNLNHVSQLTNYEHEISLKQQQINELMEKIENLNQNFNQMQHGHDAKIQERELYIESLEVEISKYKNRICRLEESISVMEDRRHSLERKADQLDSQLQEKQKAYTEYSSHEDELINRLAVLMDHDRVVEKQLNEIDSENRELQYKIQSINEENQRLKKSLSEAMDNCVTLKEKASKADVAENDAAHYLAKVRELEADLKKVYTEHQNIERNNKETIAALETEFSTQIESAIKEKKTLSEKYEKINDQVSQLEQKLQEYQFNIQNLNANLDAATRYNQELTEKLTAYLVPSPDYTEQYISEINKLNSIINSKNEEFMDYNNRASLTQSSLENKLAQLNEQLQTASLEIQKLITENNFLKESNERLQIELRQTQDQFTELAEKKKVSFEMNIPKTEGMIISSTIEALNVEPKHRILDVSSIESQIMSDVESSSQPKTTADYFQKQPEQVQEQLIHPKKAYLCYDESEAEQSEKVQDFDPFNSDEGWGLGEAETQEMAKPEFSYLNNQISKLQNDNETLRSEVSASNTKLIKALKKLKELKSSNDLLTNELNLTKQMSQSSCLDNAIEDELRNHIQELEKKIEEINTELLNERRLKDKLKQQNEVFYNTTEKLQEMKEKMDNELELWKFKYKEINDKVSASNWEVESKTPEYKPANVVPSDGRLNEEIVKLEKENDELQSVVDQLSSQIKEMTTQQSRQKSEIDSLNKQLKHQESASNEHELLNSQLSELEKVNSELRSNNDLKENNLQQLNTNYNDIVKKYDEIKIEFDDMQKMHDKNIKEILEKYEKLKEDSITLKLKLDEANSEISMLTSELNEAKLKLKEQEELTENLQAQLSSSLNEPDNSNSFMTAEKNTILEDQFHQIQVSLDDSNNKIVNLENVKIANETTINAYELQVKELNDKIEKLNTENDQLLSTVTELRSSVASAMDQRGFEIAELWKQHLAQRETEFQHTEHELRTQLSAAESKYEQLLDNFQSSNQEETTKLIMVEQNTALQSKLQDKEEHLVSLQTKYSEVINELDMLRSEMQDEKVMVENKLLEQQDEYEKQLKKMLDDHIESKKDYEQTIKTLQTDLEASDEIKSHQKSEIEDLNNSRLQMEANVIELSNQVRLKDSEVYQKCNDYSIALAQRNDEFENIRAQLLEYEKKIEDLSFEKESELAILRLKIHENTEYYEKLNKEHEAEKATLVEELSAKILECTNLNRQITELNATLEEQAVKSAEMQTALENQEIEIVTLKDELESLQQSMRSSSSKIEKHVTFSSDTKASTDVSSEDPFNDLLDAVPRAELDLALYMLHQRDVRCEELTMELTHLLDERDTLQLRLSDSLRSFEDLKSKCKAAGIEVPGGHSLEAVSELPTVSVERETQFVDTHRARSSSVNDPDGNKPALQAKLSELRTVKQSRDVTLRQDSEQRQLGMRLLHRDVANLPPEAVEQLQQAHHTLSRDSQSTSTVLLNWFRGKSTPKVVHDM